MSEVSSSPGTESPAQRLLRILQEKLSDQLKEVASVRDSIQVRVTREDIPDVFKILREDSDFHFEMLIDVTAVDWMDRKTEAGAERFEVVYQLLSLKHKCRLTLKAWVPESSPEVPSLTNIWKSANFAEREVWDMYGIRFLGHPDLRRILLYEEFQGHPLRKDYPVQGKQPRIPLRTSEVRNTATDLRRPPLAINFEPLVQLRRRANPDNSGVGIKRQVGE